MRSTTGRRSRHPRELDRRIRTDAYGRSAVCARISREVRLSCSSPVRRGEQDHDPGDDTRVGDPDREPLIRTRLLNPPKNDRWIQHTRRTNVGGDPSGRFHASVPLLSYSPARRTGETVRTPPYQCAPTPARNGGLHASPTPRRSTGLDTPGPAVPVTGTVVSELHACNPQSRLYERCARRSLGLRPGVVRYVATSIVTPGNSYSSGWTPVSSRKTLMRR